MSGFFKSVRKKNLLLLVLVGVIWTIVFINFMDLKTSKIAFQRPKYTFPDSLFLFVKTKTLKSLEKEPFTQNSNKAIIATPTQNKVQWPILKFKGKINGTTGTTFLFECNGKILFLRKDAFKNGFKIIETNGKTYIVYKGERKIIAAYGDI